jgi:hypothetical protein
VAQDVHEEEPVLSADVPGPEDDVGAGVAVDVRDPECLVADDDHARPRAVGALGLTGGDAEAGVLEVVADVGRRQAGRRVDQVAVHAELVVGVGRVGAVGLEREQVGGVEDAVRARRQDAAEAEVVVRAVRLDLSQCGRGDEQGDKHPCP